MIMELQFGLLSEVYFLNTASWRIEKAKIVKITVMPKGISKDAEGRDVLEDIVVLYELDNRMVITDTEAFNTEDALMEFLRGKYGVAV